MPLDLFARRKEPHRMCTTRLGLVAGLLAGTTSAWANDMKDYPIQPVPFTAVRVQDEFWQPRLETNRTVTIPYAFRRCEETGRIDNFAKAGGLLKGDFKGIRYDDSDVFKVIEGAAYSLALHPDPDLDRYLDDLIAKIAAAQEPDGYLYTARRLRPDNPPEGCGPTRWSYLAQSHELYNLGHLYEAAVAHHLATGKRTLLDVALKSANLVTREFGPDARHDVPGHQEIELGLVKLFRLTHDERYLRLAHFFLDQRGRPEGHKLYGDYAQDHLPVTQQDHPVGHAVRAAYMYSGMADVAALTGDEAFVRAIDRIWDNMISKRLYVTGGIGARHSGEAFGDDYELPNASAYAETCAAIANALWNYRMFLLHGDAQYIDVLERVLYNGFLAGVSLSGDRFFYVNPLASYGAAARQPWFDCACCPTNVTRFLPSIPGYIYAVRDDAVYVNLFIGGQGRIPLKDQTVTLTQQTRYPWDGKIKIAVQPEQPADFTIMVRIPGWATGQPLSGDLYHYADATAEKPRLSVNGQSVPIKPDKGYVALQRSWRPGDGIELELPLPIRRVVANPSLKEDAGRVALERGPIVYCAEATDNNGHVHNLILPDDSTLTAAHQPALLGGVTLLRGPASALRRTEDDKSTESTPTELVAVPYFAWCHREPGEMAVWLARDPNVARPVRPPTLATGARCSASHVHDALSALNDQIDPGSSNDPAIPRFTWWDHKGTTEWVQYDFEKPAKVRAVEVYWFDDTGSGQCRVPASWRVLYRIGDDWKPVTAASEYAVKRDTFNAVSFDPVETPALRLEVQLQKDFSGGILEWIVR
jgi:DUF1680 family protein